MTEKNSAGKGPVIIVTTLLLISIAIVVLPILGAPSTPSDNYRIIFDPGFNRSFNYSTSFQPVVWLYDQSNSTVIGATVSYEYRDVNGNSLISSGTATGNGDGSYTGIAINMQSYANKYVNVKFSVPQDSNTIIQQRAIYAGSSIPSNGPNWKIVVFNTSRGFSWNWNNDHKVYMTLYSDSETYMQNLKETPTITIKKSSSQNVVNGALMTYEDHGIYMYNLTAGTVTADGEYYFEIQSEWSSPEVTGGNSRFAVAIAGFNLEAVGGQGDEAPPDIFLIEHDPTFPDKNDNITISAEGIDNVRINLTVYYTVNNLTAFSKNMTYDSSGHIYTADIGRFNLDDRIRFYVSATDGTNAVNSSTDEVIIDDVSGSPNASYSYLNSNVYYFGYSRAGTTYDEGGDADYDGVWKSSDIDGVYYVQTPQTAYDFFRSMTTIRIRTVILDSKGKSVKGLTNVTAWLQANKTQAAGEKNRVKTMTAVSGKRGMYEASWTGAPVMSGSSVTWNNDSKAIWGKYDSGQIYSVYVDINEDAVADENITWLAYTIGDTFWGSAQDGKGPNHNGVESSSGCSKTSCHSPDMIQSVSRINGEPTCPDCHGVEMTANGGTWPISGATSATNTVLYGNSSGHPRFNASGNKTYCGDSACHNVSWSSTSLPSPMFIPGYGTGVSIDSLFNESSFPNPSLCADCHSYKGGIIPGDRGHNEWIGCKFCHGSMHRLHNLTDYNNSVTGDVSRGVPGYVGTGGIDGSGNYPGNCYRDCHKTQTEHCALSGQPVPCDECHQNINTAPMHQTDLSSYSDRATCGGCHQQTGNITTHNASYSMDPVRIDSTILHSRQIGNKWNRTGTRMYWGEKEISCRYCHGRSYHSEYGLGFIQDFRGTNIQNGTINSTSYWCASCHIQTYSSGGDTYDEVVTIYNTTYGVVPPEITGNLTWMSDRPEYIDHHATGKIDKSNSSTFSDIRCFDCHNKTSDTSMGMDAWQHNLSRFTGYTWVSYNDSALNNPDDDFVEFENTAYMYGTSFGWGYNYKIAYYDNSGVKVGTDTINSNSSGNLSSNNDLYGAWASGTWYAQVFNASISPPVTYDTANEDVLVEDTFYVNVEAMPEFPAGAVLPFAASFILYAFMRKKIKNKKT